MRPRSASNRSAPRASSVKSAHSFPWRGYKTFVGVGTADIGRLSLCGKASDEVTTDLANVISCNCSETSGLYARRSVTTPVLSPKLVRLTPIVCMTVSRMFATGVRSGRAMCNPVLNFPPAFPATSAGS
jgi:hypothetical protein